jgi:aminobenzoyl-glutamate utilization protein B
LLLSLAAFALARESSSSDRASELKNEAAALVDGRAKLVQEIVDSVFSFGELGFQEYETSRYLTGILEANGFTVERGIAGMPTAWVARWGSGKPVISLGTDVDCIPKASQKPGVAFHEPLVDGAPGHGEGHNSGQAVHITAALVLKQIMERERIPGTLMLWPGIAEELVGAKAHYVRAGAFRDVDAVLYAHVSSDFGVSWGDSGGSGLVSVVYTFEGEAAHSAGAPWRGRSALDAIELMNKAMNMRREHLRLAHRIHYVIRDGGDQPNVVPAKASVWYYLRETEYEEIRRLFDIANRTAKAAAEMTDTDVGWRVVGSAWPVHFNEALAHAMHENIGKVGLPAWSDADQALARALQKELGVEEKGLSSSIAEIRGPREGPRLGGPSDDIGDISWSVPTVSLYYPANIPGGPGHHWANAVAMATPIAHKGSTAGAMVIAMTGLDLLLKPELIEEAWKYFRDVQTRDVQYVPFIGEGDEPAIELNFEIMEAYREEMKKYYYDPSRFGTYLEQLGIDYPTVRRSP